MDGVDVFETYVSVVDWISVRLLLILSMVLNLQAQQVDYTNVFCQAPLEQTVFVDLPAVFKVSNKLLLLQKSVYGLK